MSENYCTGLDITYSPSGERARTLPKRVESSRVPIAPCINDHPPVESSVLYESFRSPLPVARAFSNMNQFKMNTFQMMAFVKMYQKEEVLWNTNLLAYKDRQFRRKALKRIVAGMNINGFGIKEVAQKIKNLRSTYFQEVRKIERSKMIGSPGLYKPRVPWFGIVESCLGQPRERRETLSPTEPVQDPAPGNLQLPMEGSSRVVSS